jgi:pyrroloquinoline quinone biosynthesis protein E
MADPGAPPRPYTLVAELTYKCPLRCSYCSNPEDWDTYTTELSADEWVRVLTEAEALGVMAVNLTGGEPLVRRDLERIVEHARGLGLYTNLITSGVPLTRERLLGLRALGLDHVQLSIQDAERAASDRIAGLDAWDDKMHVAAWVKEAGLPLTMNVVLHAANVDRTADLIALGERLGASRIELAHTQYLGWALVNRDHLLPTKAQIDASREVAKKARERLRGKAEVLMVLPDYVAGRPRACMDGWGRRFLVIAPTGVVLPCHAARAIPGIAFESVRERPLGDIWRGSPSFERFRGEAWMPEPCKSCDRRAVDYGGCRCQAFELTGDASRTDPACELAPDHGLIAQAVRRAEEGAPRPPAILRARGRRRLPTA